MNTCKSILALTLAFFAGAAVAQSWPVKPVRVVTASNPGTTPDLSARLVTIEMTKTLGQPFVVEARPSVGGTIAALAVSKAPSDGYIVLVGNVLGYLTIKDQIILGRDLSPLGDFADSPTVILVRGGLGVKTFEQLVAYSKANPTKLNFGAASVGHEFLLDRIKSKTGLSYTTIQYKSAPIKELLSGEIDFTVSIPTFIQRDIVPLLLFSKSAALPKVPTAVELGLMPFNYGALLGFYGSPGVPREIAQRFSSVLGPALKVPEIVQGLNKLGYNANFTTPEQQLSEYKERAEFYREAMRALNYVPEQ